MGVTEEGYKKVLGFTQATTERAEPVRELLRDLIGRGLSFDNGILCVIDGSKGLRKASMRSSETELRFNAVGGTSGGTSSAICRRPTRKHGVGNFSGHTRKRPMRPPKSGLPDTQLIVKFAQKQTRRYDILRGRPLDHALKS